MLFPKFIGTSLKPQLLNVPRFKCTTKNHQFVSTGNDIAVMCISWGSDIMYVVMKMIGTFV